MCEPVVKRTFNLKTSSGEKRLSKRVFASNEQAKRKVNRVGDTVPLFP